MDHILLPQIDVAAKQILCKFLAQTM
uniref:Uncharacterized protein n=1 Tax=Arundo donax TaxID=35708 RepID=A0A0A9FFJ0_ARUDO